LAQNAQGQHDLALGHDRHAYAVAPDATLDGAAVAGAHFVPMSKHAK
jgi:hypothetical protein